MLTMPVKVAKLVEQYLKDTHNSNQIPISGWDMLSQFQFYKMGPNKLPIYRNSLKQYLYLDRSGKWSVSYLILMSFVNNLNYICAIL